ncbi:MOSC domain-containing protein [Sphingomonas abaci]|nr:MOSC domain-containing protein [Sphingomonas abaci]
MEVIDSVDISVEGGVAGDARGLVKPGGRGRRQVTAMAREDWERALAELDPALTRDLLWQDRRANLLVQGLVLPQVAGARLRIGAEVVLAITMECDPCQRMDALRPGLRQALTPDWRGGVCTRVLAGGRIALGDIIRIEEA